MINNGTVVNQINSLIVGLFKIIQFFKTPNYETKPKLSFSIFFQVWLEAYLTNGKLSKSNVAEFHTLPAPAAPLAPLTGSDTVQTDEKNNYFRSMVAAAIIAAVGILAFVIVLYFYLRRNVTYTHTINKERPGTPSSYENNGFKETNMNSVQSLEMDSTSNGHKHNP